MSEYKSEFLRELSWRGFIKQMTHEAELDAYCASGTPVAYVGYDATATACMSAPDDDHDAAHPSRHVAASRSP
jgi:hypothetical protein